MAGLEQDKGIKIIFRQKSQFLLKTHLSERLSLGL